MPIIQATDIKPAEHFRVLFVGKSGSGKSTAAVTFPPRRFMIDLDRRARSIAGTPDLTIYQPGPRDGWQDISPVLDKTIADAEGKYPFQTTIISSVTSALAIFTNDSLNFIKSGKDVKDDPEAKAGAMKFGSLLIPGMRNYLFRGACMDQLFLNTVVQLPNNVIVEAHIMDEYNKDGEKIGEALIAPDKLSQSLPGNFDEIWYFETVDVSNSVRRHKCWFHGKKMARTAFKSLQKVGSIDWTDKNFYEEVMKIVSVQTV